jgi:ribosomal protein S18 acetylase RimI-like enzyme
MSTPDAAPSPSEAHALPEHSPFPVGWGVRLASGEDAPALDALEASARGALVDVRGGAALLEEQPAIGDWAAALTEPGRHVFVAEIDHVVVGYLELQHRAGESTGYVRQVHVADEARELGFGDELLAAAIAAIRAGGGVRVESFALPGDRDTKNLFERAGVTARKIIVSKRLDAD